MKDFLKPFKKALATVIPAAMLFGSLSVGFTAQAAATYIFKEDFNDATFPKAAKVYVESGIDTKEAFTFTVNKPIVDSCTDGRKEAMMKEDIDSTCHITYEFKDGFESFQYIGYGGGMWCGIYGKGGELFKVKWSDSLDGEYHDFKEILVENNDGKREPNKKGEMTLYRPRGAEESTATFYSNKIPSTARYLRLYFRGAGDGDMYYERWMACLISLRVKAYGTTDPHTTKAPTTTTSPTKAPDKNTTTKAPEATDSQTGATELPGTTAAGEPTGTAAPDTTTGFNGPTDEFGEPIITTTTKAKVFPLSSKDESVKVNDDWQTINLAAGSTLGDLAKALVIEGGYSLKVFDADSNMLTKNNTEMKKGDLVRIYEGDKVILTYTINPTGEAGGIAPWVIVLLALVGVIALAGICVAIYFIVKKNKDGSKNVPNDNSEDNMQK